MSNISFYNGVAGMSAYQKDMDVIAHNMANVNTTGFKSSRTAFADLLYTKMAVNGFEEGKEPLVGHGVKAAATDLDMRQGDLSNTGYPLDFAITGEGFFAVQNGDTRHYTRNGAFTLSIEGNKAFLTGPQGGRVLDSTGKAIELPRKEGSTTEFDYTGLNTKLGVFRFQNPYGLAQTDASRFTETVLSGAPVAQATGAGAAKDAPKVRTGTLESSGVDVAQSMADVIVTQRAFQMNARMVQYADQMDEVITGLRG